MKESPIGNLMSTAMQSIKEMIDVNTIVGDAVQTQDGTVIIPISRVSFGFAAGCGEYSVSGNNDNSGKVSMDEKTEKGFPFAGGSGAGISIQPVAFMVVGQGQIKLMPVNVNSSLEKMIDIFPEIMNKINGNKKKRFSGNSFEYKEPTPVKNNYFEDE